MNKLIIISILIPVIFFTVVLGMILFPVKREMNATGLNFDVLETRSIGETGSIDSQYIARDGKAIFYRYFVGDTQRVFVLLHGSATEGRYLLPLASQLHQQLGATVVVPDLRGHGRSMLSHPGDIDYIGQYEHDLADLHQQLTEEYPGAKLILVGHSSGGGLAVKYAGNAKGEKAQDLMTDKAQYSPPSFDAYVLLAPYLGHDAPTVRKNAGGWVQVSVRRIIGLSLLNRLGIHSLNDTPILFFNRPSSLSDPLQLTHYSYRLNVSFSPSNYHTELQQNTQPMLLLVGENDEAFYADKFHDVMETSAPQATVYILPNVAHLNLPQSTQTAVHIIDWLEQNL